MKQKKDSLFFIRGTVVITICLIGFIMLVLGKTPITMLGGSMTIVASMLMFYYSREKPTKKQTK